MIRQVLLSQVSASFEALTLIDEPNSLTFAAFIDDQPVGFITALIYPGIREALLICIQVLPDHQKSRLGTQLMNQLISHLKSLNFLLLNFKFDANVAITHLLNKTGWETPQLLTRRYYFDQYSFQPEWYFSAFPLLPKDFSIFPWDEATAQEIELAKSWLENSPHESHYFPFSETRYPFDKITSLGLRHQSKLAGWMINHRLNPKLLRYSAFYVLPEIRCGGAAFCMLRESIRRHLKDQIDVEGLVEINYKLSDPSWIRFVKQRLAPYASRTEDTFYAFHFLK